MSAPIGPVDVRLIADLTAPDWWNIISTAASTILGAVIGAAIAYVIARQSATENRQTLQSIRRASEETTLYSAEAKLIQLLNSVAGFHKEIEHCIESAKIQLGEKFQLWSAIKAFAGTPSELSLSADEMVPFMRAHEFTFLTKFMYLFTRYNSMLHGIEYYGQRRSELLDQLVPYQMDGLCGSIKITKEDEPHLIPRMAAMEDLAKQAQADVKEVFVLAQVVVMEFGPIVRKYLNDPTFPIPSCKEPQNADDPIVAS